jgi:hypothetical protein
MRLRQHWKASDDECGPSSADLSFNRAGSEFDLCRLVSDKLLLYPFRNLEPRLSSILAKLDFSFDALTQVRQFASCIAIAQFYAD